MKTFLFIVSSAAILLTQGCLNDSGMHDSNMNKISSGSQNTSAPSLTVMSAGQDGGLYKVSVQRNNFDYHTDNDEADKNTPTHWHLERNVSKDGNNHDGFITCSYSDELEVDASMTEGSTSMIVSMRDSDHNMIGQGYHMMGEGMQMQCMNMQDMNMDGNGHMMDMSSGMGSTDGSDGHMMDMSSGMNGMGDSSGHMMDMSSGMGEMGAMQMMPMCAWQTEAEK